jgi:hypothetical protein
MHRGRFIVVTLMLRCCYADIKKLLQGRVLDDYVVGRFLRREIHPSFLPFKPLVKRSFIGRGFTPCVLTQVWFLMD